MVKAYRPKNLEEALNILGHEDCIVFAGGTDLMVKRKNWSGLEPCFEKPVVFISDLGELRRISTDNNILTIGAACPCTKIMEYRGLPSIFYEVLEQMASPGIRDLATLGGNICNSSPAGDSLPLLYALDATLRLQSLRGVREIAIERFVQGPGRNIIDKDEILTSITIPLKNFTKTSYKKVGTRKSTALSKLSFVGLLQTEGNTIKDVRISFGAVGPTIVRSRVIESEIAIASQKGSIDIDLIKNKYTQLINPISDQRSSAQYRKSISLGLLQDFLKTK